MDQMHVDDRDAEIAALKAKSASMKLKVKIMQNKVDIIEKKIVDMEGDRGTMAIHDIPNAVLNPVEDGDRDDLESDVNGNECVSRKGHKPKPACLVTTDFRVGLTERKKNANVLLYYYDADNCVKKFCGMSKLRNQVNFFCAHCKITARLKKGKNKLEMLHAHKDYCRGEDRKRFILEQKRRRSVYDEKNDDKFLLCNKYVSSEQMYDDNIM